MAPKPKEVDAASLASNESSEHEKQEKHPSTQIRKSPRRQVALPTKKPTDEMEAAKKPAAKKPVAKKLETKKRKALPEELRKAKERKKKTIEKRHKRLEARKKQVQESKTKENPLLVKSLDDINFYKLLLMSSSPSDIVAWLKKCHEEAPLNEMALGFCRWARFCSMGKAKHWRPAAIVVLRSRYADSFPKPGDGNTEDDIKKIMALMDVSTKVQGLVCITEEQEPRSPFA